MQLTSCVVRQHVTSDVTLSLFTGDKFVTTRGHASNTHGIGGESNRGLDSEGAGLEYGTVVYPDGSIKKNISGTEET